MRQSDLSPEQNSAPAENQIKGALVDSLYMLLSEPVSYTGLIDALNATFATVVDREEAAGGDFGGTDLTSELSDTVPHFNRTAMVLDRLIRHSGETSDKTTDDNAAHPVLLVDSNRAIVYANSAAHTILKLKVGDDLSALPVDADIGRNIERQMRKMWESESRDLFVILPAYAPEQEHRMLFTLSAEPANGASSQPSAGEDALVRIEGVGLDWSPDVAERFGQTFGLTIVEKEVLRALVEGQSIAELAQRRKRSVETVRGQAKSLLKKTGARSQVDVVRMFAAISLAFGAHGPKKAQPGMRADSQMTTEYVEIEAGRRMQVDIMGPKDGVPVFMLHGLASGTRLTQAGHAALHKYGLRIYAPWRPLFAGSDPVDRAFKDTPRGFAADIEVLMSHFGIDRAIMFGRFSGAIYAVAAANALGDKIAGVVIGAGTPPIRHRRQLDVIAPWQRMFAYSARYFPIALPVLMRGSIQLMVNRKGAQLFEGLYQTPEEDAQTWQRPEVQSILEQNWHSSMAQGSKGYEIDVGHTALDWSALYDDLKQPTLLIHGQEDPVTTIDQVRDLVADYPHLELMELEKAGQLFCYSRPEFVFKTIADFAARSFDRNA